ncbi:MAG: PilN domain-containing protein [Acidobacteriota bacterium]|nr:PilN domain-containing protein [Acidobacteriota bacterium]
MIKINLLDSVTERNNGTALVVERKMSSPFSRLVVMAASVAVLLLAVIAWDVISTRMAKVEAERQLAEQKQIATELEAVTKEMKELDQKIQNIDVRIETIKRLRASQAGPSAVLEAMRERIGMVPGLYLEGIEQKGEQLTITGSSPDEAAVTQFGKSLEFSSGLFSNLNIETQRKEAPNQAPTSSIAGQQAPPKLEIVGFTIRCAYTPSKAAASQSSSPMTATNTPSATNPNQAASAPPNSAASMPQPPPQVAKN